MRDRHRVPELMSGLRPTASRMSSACRAASNHSASTPSPSVPPPAGDGPLHAASSNTASSAAARGGDLGQLVGQLLRERPLRSSTWRAVTSGVPSPSKRPAETSAIWPMTWPATSPADQPVQRLGACHSVVVPSERTSSSNCPSSSIRPGTTSSRRSVTMSPQSPPPARPSGRRAARMLNRAGIDRQSNPANSRYRYLRSPHKRGHRRSLRVVRSVWSWPRTPSSSEKGSEAPREPRPDLEVVALVDDLPSLLDAVAADPPDVVVTDIRMPPTGTDEGVQAADPAAGVEPRPRRRRALPVRRAGLRPGAARRRLGAARLPAEGARLGPGPAGRRPSGRCRTAAR